MRTRVPHGHVGRRTFANRGCHGHAGIDGQETTSALAQSRLDFLRAYNGIAKHGVQVLLTHLGRESEYRVFFLDLQANEGGTSSEPTPDDEPAGEPEPEPEPEPESEPEPEPEPA